MVGLSGVMSTAAAGMMSAVGRTAADAQAIASPGGLNTLPQSAVDLDLNRLSFSADALVFKTTDKMLGNLLDVLDTTAPR